MTAIPNRQMRRTSTDGVGRWLLVAGAIGSVAYLCAWIIAGAVRPGYSPIHQAISDLAVGPTGLPYRIGGVLTALLKIGFAAGFALLALGWPRRSSRYAATALLSVWSRPRPSPMPPRRCASISIATAIGAVGRLLAMVSVGIVLLAGKDLRGWGVYSLAAAGIPLLLFVAEYASFAPSSPLASARIGGLMERIFVIELEAWDVLLAIGLFRFAQARGASSGIGSSTRRPAVQ